MTDDEATAMLKELSVHYKEPVMPVSRYCRAFKHWFEALRELAQLPETADRRRYNESLIAIGQSVDTIALAIHKSSFLARMIYGGQQPRTKMCPLHKGRWSGLYPTRPDHHAFGSGVTCECWDGIEASGWIPNTDDKQ